MLNRITKQAGHNDEQLPIRVGKIAENSMFFDRHLWSDNSCSMHLIDICVVQGRDANSVMLSAMKLVDDGFATDIEDAIFQVRAEALQNLSVVAGS